MKPSKILYLQEAQRRQHKHERKMKQWERDCDDESVQKTREALATALLAILPILDKWLSSKTDKPAAPKPAAEPPARTKADESDVQHYANKEGVPRCGAAGAVCPPDDPYLCTCLTCLHLALDDAEDLRVEAAQNVQHLRAAKNDMTGTPLCGAAGPVNNADNAPLRCNCVKCLWRRLDGPSNGAPGSEPRHLYNIAGNAACGAANPACLSNDDPAECTCIECLRETIDDLVINVANRSVPDDDAKGIFSSKG